MNYLLVKELSLYCICRIIFFLYVCKTDFVPPNKCLNLGLTRQQGVTVKALWQCRAWPSKKAHSDFYLSTSNTCQNDL